MASRHPKLRTLAGARRHSKTLRKSLWRRAGGFVGWVFTGFGLWHAVFGRAAKKGETIIVYTIHPAFYVWPLMVTGFVGAACVERQFGDPQTWGWIYLWTIIFTLVMFLFELTTARLLFWLMVLAFLWLGLRYMEDLKNLPWLSAILRYFDNLHPKYDPGLTRGISTLLVPAWVGAIVHSFLEGKKTFTPNSIEERYVGHGCEIVDRAGLKFRANYRNLIQTVLGFGAADLEAINGDGVVVKRFRNILFLSFAWNRLDEILHQRAAVVDNAPDDPVEVEEVRHVHRK